MSSKVAGETASLTNPALDRILDFAGEVGLVVILHNDIDMPFAKPDAEPVYLDADEGAAPAASEDDDHLGAHRPRPRRAPGAGVGARRRSAVPNHVEIVEAMLTDPALGHVNFDISWDEVAKYAVASPRVDRARRGDAQPVSRPVPVRDRHRRAGRPGAVLRACSTCGRRVWRQLTPDASLKVRKGNYERLFDEARATRARVGTANVK